MPQSKSESLTVSNGAPVTAPTPAKVPSGGNAIRRIGKTLLSSPGTQVALEWTEGWCAPLRYLHRRVYDREFARVVPWARRFNGVFATFEEAIQGAPAGKPVGYDNSAAASFMEPSGQLLPSDYPVLFWLQQALADKPVLLDIGGYVGISYYTYRNYLSYPENLEWIIQDVPAVATAGTEIARTRESRGLSFTTDITSALRPHAVLAAGSLQFIEHDFADLLRRMGALPTHLIVNKTPLTDSPEFVTLQDLGPAVCAYRILNRARLVRSIEDLGYRLVDSWSNLDFSCRIPFHPDRNVSNYSGLYFKLNA